MIIQKELFGRKFIIIYLKENYKMTHQEFIVQFLPVIMQVDIRLKVHSFEEIDGVWNHKKNCPRCVSLFILGYEQEMEFNPEKLSTVE